MKLDAAAVNQTSSGMEVAVDTGAAGATRVALESTSEWRVDYIQYDGQERYIACVFARIFEKNFEFFFHLQPVVICGARDTNGRTNRFHRIDARRWTVDANEY